MARLVMLMECMDCGHQQPGEVLGGAACQACQSAWLQPLYDYAGFKRELLRGLPGRPFNLWRYRDVLPIADAAGLPSPAVCGGLDAAGAGGTPLLRSSRYAQALRHGQFYIKDERHGPTSSFKDRQAAVSVAAMLEAGVRGCVIASTGNAAVAYAAACARAGIKLWVLMTSLVPQAKLREAALFGAEVIKVGGTYDQTKQIAADFARRRGLLLERGASSIPARESFKTIAYEIVEQLDWQAPDWYVQAVSGGLGPLGVYRGFQELHAMGLIQRIPALAVIQVEGCAPMVRAFQAGKDVAAPVIPETRIAILSTGDPGQAYTQVWRIVQRYGGAMESVTDAEAFDAMHALARAEGLAVEPSAAVAFAGAEKLIQQGLIHGDDRVVVNCSGHTFPVEKHILGDEWHVDLQLEENLQPAPREGLHSALDCLDERTTSVLVVDDNPDDVMLIRRLLTAKKAYRIFQAADGAAGLAEARLRRPDLIVLDLTMPRLDGFSMLEQLKSDAVTRHIPVIVVSARDITDAERQRLSGRVEALYQKGSLSPRAFVGQVVHMLDDKDRREACPYGHAQEG